MQTQAEKDALTLLQYVKESVTQMTEEKAGKEEDRLAKRLVEMEKQLSHLKDLLADGKTENLLTKSQEGTSAFADLIKETNKELQALERTVTAAQEERRKQREEQREQLSQLLKDVSEQTKLLQNGTKENGTLLDTVSKRLEALREDAITKDDTKDFLERLRADIEAERQRELQVKTELMKLLMQAKAEGEKQNDTLQTLTSRLLVLDARLDAPKPGEK